MRIARGLYNRVFDRKRLALPLVFPCWGGLYYLWAYDAPARLIAVNAGALALALVWVLLGRLPTRGGRASRSAARRRSRWSCRC